MKMDRPLRVLMVEDSEDDAVLMIHALTKGGWEATCERVENPEAMRKALIKGPWDVVLCDYQMPKFNGLAAIALLKETGIDIPLIIVSGAIGEETAVECMRRGASDYVMKDSLSRLIPAIERELKEAESRSQRRQAEEALREAHDIINKSSTVVFTWKNEEGWPVEYVSGNVVRLFGYEAEEFMTGRVNYAACIHPEDVKGVAEEVAEFGNKKDTIEFDHKPYRIIAKDGSEKIVRDWTFIVRNGEGRITQYKGLVEDITERIRAHKEQKRLEVQLRHAQRMEAISTLAGGIAHDFNNILSAVMGYAQLAQMKLDRDSEPYEDLKEVVRSANRAKLLIRQILAVGRSQDQEKQPMQLKYTVKEALKLLRSTLPSTIEIREAYDKDVGIIAADPTQMHQVVMNLCTNAAHAMQQNGGILELDLGNVEFAVRDEALNLGPGGYLRLTVSDTGCGMTPDIVGRIFEPYFTTKPKGVGTGLGLPVAYGIVSQHGGIITLDSEQGKGSRFHVYLPLIQAEEERPATEEEAPLPRGNERILFVDDEVPLAAMGKEMLRRLGYDVTSMTGSIEALALFKQDPQRFDLVITDTTMPHMPGDILAQEMIGIRPDIPIIICTGHSERMSKEKAEEMGIRAFLMKPIEMRNLARTVRDALDAARDAVGIGDTSAERA